MILGLFQEDKNETSETGGSKPGLESSVLNDTAMLLGNGNGNALAAAEEKIRHLEALLQGITSLAGLAVVTEFIVLQRCQTL